MENQHKQSGLTTFNLKTGVISATCLVATCKMFQNFAGWSYGNFKISNKKIEPIVSDKIKKLCFLSN